MTCKEKVLAQFPRAFSYKRKMFFHICSDNLFGQHLGAGLSPRAAWADAQNNLQKEEGK
jgi:hypothetical protein